jgi:hypothetical protein
MFFSVSFSRRTTSETAGAIVKAPSSAAKTFGAVDKQRRMIKKTVETRAINSS